MDPINPISGNPESLNPNPVPPRIPADNHGMTILAMAVFVLLALGAVAFLYYQNQQLKGMLANYQTPVASPTPVATADPTANWKKYTNKTLGIEFKYPENYILLKETPNIELGFGVGTESPVTYLTITKKLTDFSLYKTCSESDSTPCFNNAGWNQTVGIANIKVGGNDAKSIYYTSGVDTDTHVVQTTTPQKLELKMNIAGGKLDYNFQQILSTFKFLEQNQVTEEEQVRSFAEEFARTYALSDWTKLKTMLTKQASQDMTQNNINLSPEGVPVYSYSSIISITKNTSGGYDVELGFLLNGQPIKNPAGNPVIKVVKENGEWKSMSWYLFQ